MTPEEIKAAVAIVRKGQPSADKCPTTSAFADACLEYVRSLVLLMEVAEKVAEAPIAEVVECTYGAPAFPDSEDESDRRGGYLSETFPHADVGHRFALVRLTDNTENSNGR